MVKELDWNVTPLSGYSIDECYRNHYILEILSNKSLNLRFISRGEINLSDKIKPTSEEFYKEIAQWISDKKLEIINVCNEKYPMSCLTFFLKVEKSDIFCLFTFFVDKLNYDVFASTRQEAIKIVEILEEKFKEGESTKKSLKFAFWQRDPEENSALTISNHKCPSLEEIRNNYHPKLWDQVNKIIELKDPYLHGKIILYHGPAGTGKTYLIRALARVWHEKYGVIPEVIIDPEDFYETPRYLTSLLLEGTSRVYSKKDPPFRLIIAEDCAQLFSLNCRNQTGFSRLLNTVDGLLGQGQKLIFVFTANEQIDSIDPAILRPGRCLQNLEVPTWTKKDVEKWFKDQNAEKMCKFAKDNMSLAEMYAILKESIYTESGKINLGFK